ncbi:MAG: hypothetical protein A2X86_01890 [Bdellovibrionales bacterium GWA2_49_15]|nr:MAG: hypothetical protein A2X86_01890 [Bdellovibrionales bacterium GWA2_49_15]
MKSVQSVFFFLFLFSTQAFAGNQVHLAISNVEDITEKLKDLLAFELARPISFPSTTIKECEKIELQCLLGEAQLRLARSAQDFNFKIEAMPGQTFIYTLELPKATGVVDFVVRGKVLGRVYDMKFKIEAASISTIKEQLDGPDIEWLKGSGKLFLEIKNNLFVASSINFPRWHLDHVQITPMDRLAQIFMSTFGRFADLEKMALVLLNSQIQTYLQDANMHLTFAKTLNTLFAKAPTILAPFKNFGVNASLAPTSFSTEQRKVSIALSSQLEPTLEAHSCAGKLQATKNPLNLKSFMMRRDVGGTEESNAIKVSWPLAFFEHAFYLMAKYPFIDRRGKPTPPLLCQSGESEISILGKKQKFAYNFVPVKTIHLKSEEDNSGNLSLNLWAELRGQSDQYPKLTLRRYENKQKIPSILINIEARLLLALTDKGLMFELKDLKFNEVIGKARLSWRLPLLGISIPLSKIKADLEKVVITYIENNMGRMILLSPTIEISEGHSLVLSNVKLSNQEITSTLILK